MALTSMAQDLPPDSLLQEVESRSSSGQAGREQASAGEVPAITKAMLVLTDDEAQQAELQLCASKMGLGVHFLNTGMDLLQVLTDRQVNETGIVGDHETGQVEADHFALLVLGGQVPTWVHLDLVARLKSGLAKGQHYRSGILIPIMFLSQDGNLKLVMEQISRGLLADFMQLPIRQTELQIRLEALMERWDMVASVSAGSQAEAVNDFSESVFGDLTESEPSDYVERQASPFRPVERPNGDKIWGDYIFSPSQNTATIGGKQIRLTNREFIVAWTLFSALGNVVTRDELRTAMARRHRSNKEIMNRSLDAYICRLRVLLNLTSEGSMSLMPVYGVGYVLRPNQD